MFPCILQAQVTLSPFLEQLQIILSILKYTLKHTFFSCNFPRKFIKAVVRCLLYDIPDKD